MPFRRRSTKMNNKITRAAQAACEPLENRRMLTALVNGVFTGTNSVFEGQTFYEYRQANGNATVRISVTGNITAEFIGGTYDLLNEDFNHVTIGDLVPATQTTSATFLFSIYVAQADINSAISIAVVPNDATPPPTRPMQPFTGTVATQVLNASTRALNALTTAAGTGGVYIGALSPTTLDNQAQQSIPLTFATRRAFGLRPSSAGVLFAGLETAPGVSLGKFFVGGTITGIVDVGGSMDTFYAGNIWTGNAQGIPSINGGNNGTTALLGNPTPLPQNNFHIGGDIRNILVGGSIGTDALVTNGRNGFTEALESPNYKTGFQLSVGGRVGQIVANNSILASGTVANNANFVGLGGAQHEIENRTAIPAPPPPPAVASDFSFFDPQFQGFNIAVAGITQTGDNVISARLNNNDNFGTAQFLGTARSAILKTNSAIDLRGTLSANETDLVDYYAVPMLAGQTFDVQLRDDLVGRTDIAHPHVGIFDPDGRLIATDYSDVNTFARTNQTIRIKADRPGAYRIAIALNGDANFSGVSEAGEVGVTLIDYNYELRVTNIGDLALGGLISTGPIGTIDQGFAGFNVLRGDFGEVRAGTPVVTFNATTPFANNSLTNTGTVLGTIFSRSLPWKISSGNLRALEAVSTGDQVLTGTTFNLPTGSGPDFLVPKGSIGLLRSTGTSIAVGAQSILTINDSPSQADPVTGLASTLFPIPTDSLSNTDKSLAVGKDIQLVDCGGILEGDLLANGGIGVIRAQQVGGGLSQNGDVTVTNIIHASNPVWQVNVDNSGNDGIIDLIDVTGNLNSAAITTGNGGNVRYMHVGGIAYRDSFFGNSIPENRLLAPGQKFAFTDDSGTQAVLSPAPLTPNTTNPLPQNAGSAFLDPARLTLQSYPIRDKGGEVLIRVIVTPQDDTTDNIVRAGGGGLLVDTGSRGNSSSFEIGEVARGNPSTISATLPTFVLPAGTAADPFTFDPFNRLYTLTALTGAATDPRDVTFTFKGKSKVDVWNINDLLATDTITSIDNQTSGEIVNMTSFGVNGAITANLPDVFSISAETLGLATSHTGTAVEGLSALQVTAGGLDNIFPFVLQRNLVRVSDVTSIAVRRGLGNILADNIGTIVANSGHKAVSGVFEGINAPVVSRGLTNLTGNILSVDIGEGIAPSGTGYVSQSGLYADGVIDAVRGSGANVDIRGNIVAASQAPVASQQAIDPVTLVPRTNPDGTPLIVTTPTSAIGSITLKGGSIIDANIIANQAVAPATVGAVASSNEFERARNFLPEALDTLENPFYDIGPITVSGNGGVLGTLFSAEDMGLLTVKGGFGVLASTINLFGGILDGIVADGYGIRDDNFSGNGIHTLSARGNGKAAAVTSFASSARFSDKASFDPYSGETLTPYNDLNRLLGTSKSKPKISSFTDTGLIEDCNFLVGGAVGKISAQRILARTAVFTDPKTGKKTRTPFGVNIYPLQFNISAAVGSITVRDTIDGLQLTSGDIGQINVGKDVVNSLFTVAGRLKSLAAGSLRSSTAIHVNGADGQIDSIVTKNDLSSEVTAQQSILAIKVGKNINSKNIRSGGHSKSIAINGSILTGSRVVVKGTLSKLFIGQDIKAGASLQAGAINKQQINGQVIGDIVIT